jgi:hypothetical protein
MEIEGKFHPTFDRGSEEGALYTTGTESDQFAAGRNPGKYLGFKASRNWTGSTSEPSNSSSGTPSDNTTDSNDSSATENRPKNYTIRVWKRIA